ncbi:MAG: hypothetical protein PUD91_06140 [Bacteroidales bacterium]|nr:hypothetical protein [Bacteroidales bacterium]
MDSFKSDVVKINHCIDKVYAKLSTPSSFKNIANIAALPEDVKQRIGEIEFGDDSIAFNANPIGKVELRVVEREEPGRIVMQAVQLPIPLKVIFSLSDAGNDTTEAVVDIQVELNMFIRPMVQQPLTDGAKKFGELLAMLPYDAM